MIQRHDSFEPKQCKKCREYIIELDDKYFGGVILATKPINPNAIPKIEPTDTLRDIAADNTDDFESSKRKRGRPKGSKNKRFMDVDEYIISMPIDFSESEIQDEIEKRDQHSYEIMHNHVPSHFKLKSTSFKRTKSAKGTLLKYITHFVSNIF